MRKLVRRDHHGRATLGAAMAIGLLTDESRGGRP